MDGQKARKKYQTLSTTIGTTGMNYHHLMVSYLKLKLRLIVLHSLRKEMLDRIHESHQGIVKSKQPAQDILFWSDMSSQIEDKVSKCSVCSQLQRTQPKEEWWFKSAVGTEFCCQSCIRLKEV